jgi:cytidyltransferase-like protein
MDAPDGWIVTKTKRYGTTLVTMLEPHQRGRDVTVGLIPGSFDPFHNGHLEMVERASQIFDEIVVAAIRNPQKSEALFDLDERREMIADSLAHVKTSASSPSRPCSSMSRATSTRRPS